MEFGSNNCCHYRVFFFFLFFATQTYLKNVRQRFKKNRSGLQSRRNEVFEQNY